MKRFHIHVGVRDLGKSVEFYSTLFGQKPSKLKDDYAKWMLEDPRVNFAISTRTEEKGLDHLGLQVDDDSELDEITERLKKADLGVFDEGETTCCYAESKKAWVQDPTGIAWEAYRTMADAELFRGKDDVEEEAACCPGDEEAEGESACCG
jgi:catechol 2,3-dioxygenase-like lactoylglutathione lyase family enzyme